MKYFFRFLAVALVGFAGSLCAQDFTIFGGFQNPGAITLSSGVSGVGSAVGQARVDPKNFGIFGARLYHPLELPLALLGLEHTVAYSPNFIDSDGSAFLFSTNLRVGLPSSHTLRPYATAGLGAFRAGGGGAASFGTKFSLNYGGGLNVMLRETVGIRFDVRLHSIRGVEGNPLNVLEPSVGIFLMGF